ncbi:MAG: 6-carboxytetrahydropterin synthase, partial [Pyrinomonadaceae bacterium]
MSGFYEVMIERNFSSAHQLRGYKGKCENLHGHNYKIEIYAKGEELNNIGLLIDFGDLKAAADEIVMRRRARLALLPVLGLAEDRPPGVVPADPPHRAITRLEAALTD